MSGTKNKSYRDYIGEKIGHLKIIDSEFRKLHSNSKTSKYQFFGVGFFKVRCDCGNVVWKRCSSVLKANQKVCTVKCGLNPSSALYKYLGKKFGHLNVVGINGKKLKCVCDCGNERYIDVGDIKRVIGYCSNNCEFLIKNRVRKFRRLIGQTHYHLKVVDIIVGADKYDNNHNRVYVKCKCDCGKLVNIRVDQWCRIIKLGNKKTSKMDKNRIACNSNCNFAKKHVFNIRSPHVGDISVCRWNQIKKDATGLRRRKWSKIKTRDDIPFKISIKYAWKLFLKQQRKCSLSGKKLYMPNAHGDSSGTASLDRIDSKKGYIKGNVQWIHKDINKMKWNFNQDYFLDVCKKVFEHNQKE